MQHYSPVIICILLFVYFCTLCFRAFGDKSNPPSLPDAEGDGEAVEEEEREVDEGDEQTQEPSPDSETTTEQACSVIEQLSVTEPGDDTIGKSQNPEEEEEAEQDSPKMTQGIAISLPSACFYVLIHHHLQNTWSTYCQGVIGQEVS